MRTFDMSPLYRSTIGFDRLFNLIDGFNQSEQPENAYPPYNIERVSDNAYRISMAVAGFVDAELSIESRESKLLVKGQKEADDKNNESVLYRGIASRNFERRFQLADHVEIKGAVLENGLLHIDLVRELPEAMKPRKIEIANSNSKQKTVKKLEAKAA